MVTKKTNDDLFWLAPSPLVNQILLYLLLLKAKKYGVLVHSFVVMSNHIHFVVTDCRKKLPRFAGEFLGESGKALQLARNTDRKIWSSKRYGAVQLLDLDAAEREIAYSPLNPMEAELTEPEEWPGLTSARLRFGDKITAQRPEIYFSARRPESVDGVLAPLSWAFFGDETADAEGSKERRAAPGMNSADAASESRIRGMIERRCTQIRRDLARRGKRLAGAAAVMKMPCTNRTGHPIRELNPRFATRDRELLMRAIAEMRQFEIDHEVAKRRYIAGRQKTLFPAGTYGYQVVLGVRVAKGRPAA